MRAVRDNGYFGGEGEGRAFFLSRQVYFIVFFTAEESRINTDKPYAIFFFFFCARAG